MATKKQIRYLMSLLTNAYGDGVDEESIDWEEVEADFGEIDVENLTRKQASALIDDWRLSDG
jgi:hypothetical protein